MHMFYISGSQTPSSATQHFKILLSERPTVRQLVANFETCFSCKYASIIFNQLLCEHWYIYRYKIKINQFLAAFAKLRKATMRFIMSVCPKGRNIAATTGRIFMKFEYFSKIC
jgi:hypothetical protein